MISRMAIRSSFRILFISLLALSATKSLAEENTGASLSIGSIRDQVEGSAIRILAKYGDSLNITDKLVPQEGSGNRRSFYALSQQFKVDTADKGNFGGVSFRYGVKYYNEGVKTDPNAPPREDGKPVIKFDGDQWMHVIPINIGADADRNFNNHDYLVEVGYIPALYKAGDSCFKIGANPIFGVGGQLGYRKRNALPTATGQLPEQSGPLRRLKLEGKAGLDFGCLSKTSGADQASTRLLDALLSGILSWQLSVAGTGWRDFVEQRNYKKYEGVLSIPTGPKSSIDIKREFGAAPTDFDTGAKFSANLTIEF